MQISYMEIKVKSLEWIRVKQGGESMKRRRIKRKEPSSGRIVKYSILAALILSLAGVSYAAHTNVLTTSFNFNSSGMSFIFDQDKDVVVQLQKGSEVKELRGKADYKEKKLIISGIGPLDIEDFADGDARITIQYAIETEDEENSILRPAEIKQISESDDDPITVDFKLLRNTPVWSLNNGEKGWGTITDEVKGTPGIIYKLLPDSLGTFEVYNQLLAHDEDGVMVGTLLLKQVSGPEQPEPIEIKLSSLDLPDGISKEIDSDSLLEVKGSYGFTIPLDLDQFNVEQ